MVSPKLHSAQATGDDSDVNREKRDEIVMVRVTAAEKKAWEAAAENDQRTLADWIRIVVNGQAGFKPKKRRRS